MPWNCAVDTDIGDRDEQQDRFLMVQSPAGDRCLLVVADGAGGHKTGGAAAEAAIEHIRDQLPGLLNSKDPQSLLYELVQHCNERVLKVGGDELACTTLVIVLADDDQVFWAHVGDSRVYLLRHGETVVRTTDHSLIELQRVNPSAVSDTEHAVTTNQLYMCLGALDQVTPDTDSSLVRDGDTLLLCSDGLWNQVDMQPVTRTLSMDPVNTESLRKWANLAKERGAGNSDNITLIAARYHAKPGLFNRILSTLRKPFDKLRHQTGSH